MYRIFNVILICLCCITAFPVKANEPYTPNTKVNDVINDSVFDDYGRLIFPVDQDIDENLELKDVSKILPWYHNINTQKTVEIVNYMKSQVTGSKTIFYDIYSDEEKQEDPEKENTGLFFFRGNKKAKTAILNAGGGFMYVGAIHDSFPAALELSKKGYNAFALIYRPDADKACEDLSRAIIFLKNHADDLGIDMSDYSIWGGSAGARMAAWIGTNGTKAYGEKQQSKPAAVIIEYTGLSEVTGKEPPTFAVVGTKDSIADYRVMKKRIKDIQNNGTDAKIEIFKGLQHGFGLGQNTKAEGWLDDAVLFWEDHMTEKM